MNSLRTSGKRRAAKASSKSGTTTTTTHDIISQSSPLLSGAEHQENSNGGYFHSIHGMEMEQIDHVNIDDGGAAKSFKTKKAMLRLRNYKTVATMRRYLILLGLLGFGLFLMFLSLRDESDVHRASNAMKRLGQKFQNREKKLSSLDQQQNMQQQQQQQRARESDPAPKKRSASYQRTQTDKTYYDQLAHQKQFFTDPRHLPKLPSSPGERDLLTESFNSGRGQKHDPGDFRRFIAKNIQEWEEEADDYPPAMLSEPFIDYTKLKAYKYAWHDDLLMTHDLSLLSNGLYPHLQPLGDLMKEWPQDDIDHPPVPIVEYLMRFDYQNPNHLQAAERFREAQLPFKVYNVPELEAAREKWTDDYCAEQFDHTMQELHATPAQGTCQRSNSNFFAFFQSIGWNINTLGPPPTIDTDLSFALWAKHARYADKVGLPPDAVHYYWQAGVPARERHQPHNAQCFISKDLPSFSSRTNTFFVFNVAEQKGIQCRFGERGVTAATHYDAGRNMVAMITGAKRYILSPPKACSKLGVVTLEGHPSFRHSMLNFAHLNLLNDDGKMDPEMRAKLLETMSPEEREWLTRAKDAPSLSTVLKAGEVLYIPSHWFHYIISLQKSAQCNVRSGREKEGHPIFGGFQDVIECK